MGKLQEFALWHISNFYFAKSGKGIILSIRKNTNTGGEYIRCYVPFKSGFSQTPTASVSGPDRTNNGNRYATVKVPVERIFESDD